MTAASPVEIARGLWGDSIPDWVIALAEECGRSSQGKVAKQMNRSAALVSNVLRNKYGGDPSLDHALELGAAVVGRGCAGFDKGFDQLQAARLAIGFALLLLVGNGNVMLRLPRRRNAQVKGGA